jgi:hypothetical protein
LGERRGIASRVSTFFLARSNLEVEIILRGVGFVKPKICIREK